MSHLDNTAGSITSPRSNPVADRVVRCSESTLRMENILLMVNSESILSTGSFRNIGRLGPRYMGSLL